MDSEMLPYPDFAEDNAFFPSAYSLKQFTSPNSDLSGADYADAYSGGRWKVLMIATDERYLLMANGTMFSTGNHPVEMLLPMYHFDKAGFEIDIATLSGNPVKLELWALPHEDAAVLSIYEKYRSKLKKPLKLADIVESDLGDGSAYLGVFIPGGHGALIGIPFSRDVRAVLDWANAQNRTIVSLCHGPAGLLAAGIDRDPSEFPFKGYSICVFPDDVDRQTPEIGYMPGPMPWFIGDALRTLGIHIINSDITGKAHVDRNLITGDSPFASNNVGKLGARALIDAALVLDHQ